VPESSEAVWALRGTGTNIRRDDYVVGLDTSYGSGKAIARLAEKGG